MSGILALLAAIGASGPVALPGGYFERARSVPNSATVGLRFQTDGEVWADTSGSYTFRHRWYTPTTAGIGNSYWVRATVTSGVTPTTGTVGSWLALSSNQTWTVTQPGEDGITASVLSISIASDSGGSNILATASYTLLAEVV